jgi:fucose 4-O-acetylase-like acetyltransferase
MIKGAAIIFVVVGHLLQYTVIDFDHNILWRFIYSFHMPLFFFVSGFLAFFTKKKGFNLILDRFKSLIIPFFSWAIVYYFIRDNLDKGFLIYMRDLVLVPDIGLWFLWVLFFCYLILAIVKWLKFKLYFSVFLICTSLLLLSFVLKNNIFGLNLLAKQLPFFFFGFLVNNYKTFFYDKLQNNKIIIIVLFLLSASFWMRKEDPLFYSIINLGAFFKLGYIIYVGVLGILSTLIVFLQIKDNTDNKFFLTLSFLGKHTLSIYAIHFLLIDYVHIDYNNYYYFLLFIYCLIIIVLCVLIEYLFRLNSTASKIFFAK